MLNEGFQPQAEVTVGYQHYKTVYSIQGFMHFYLPDETLMLMVATSYP